MVYLGTSKVNNKWLGTNLLNKKKMFPGLLDKYPATAAYSAGRRLKSDQTYAMTIRRESDNAETDIGFDAQGNTDESAIASFCGTSDGFVPLLVDATGNGYDAVQPTATFQPKIYDGATTSVITENGKPALEWPSFLNNIKLGADVGSLPVGESFVVAKFEGEQFPTFNGLLTSFDNTGSVTVSIGLIGNSVSDVWYSVAKWWNDLRHNGSQISTPFTAFPLIKDLSLVSFSSNAPVDIGGISIGFDRVFLNRGWQGTIQEVILFDSDQLTNRTAIENNINNYYGIY